MKKTVQKTLTLLLALACVFTLVMPISVMAESDLMVLEFYVDGELYDTVSVDYDTPIGNALPEAPADLGGGRVFIGWQNMESGEFYPDSDLKELSPMAWMTFEALWDDVSTEIIQLEFYVDGGLYEAIEVPYGDKVGASLPAEPVDPSGKKVFVAWKDSDTGTAYAGDSLKDFYPEYNTFFDAIWEDASTDGVPITFHDIYRNNKTDSFEHQVGDAVPGYFPQWGTLLWSQTFAGWNTEPDGTGEWYGGNFSPNAVQIFEGMDLFPSDLYAMFSVDVTYEVGGMQYQWPVTGAQNVKETILAYLDHPVREITDPMFAGWGYDGTYNDFWGWSTSLKDMKSDAIKFSADGSYGSDVMNLKQGAYLYAIYQPRVTYAQNGFGGWELAYDDTVGRDHLYTLLPLEDVMFASWQKPSDKTFQGWYFAGEPDVVYQPGDEVMIYGNPTLRIKWEETAHEIRFHDIYRNHKTDVFQYREGDAVPGYFSQWGTLLWSQTFAGWNTEPDGSGDWYGGSFSPNAATKFETFPSDLYAMFSVDVTYEVGGMQYQWPVTGAQNVKETILAYLDHPVREISDPMFAGWGYDGTYNEFWGWSASLKEMKSDAMKFSADGSYGSDVMNLKQGAYLYAIYQPRVTFRQNDFGGWKVAHIDTQGRSHQFVLPGLDDSIFAEWEQPERDFQGWYIAGKPETVYWPGDVVEIYGNVEFCAVK